MKAWWAGVSGAPACASLRHCRMDVAKIQEKKAALEEELRRTEKQIYDLEGEYLQVL